MGTEEDHLELSLALTKDKPSASDISNCNDLHSRRRFLSPSVRETVRCITKATGVEKLNVTG
jgi:hypothetical protein